MTPLSKSPFSLHFTILAYFGFWLLETKNPFIISIFSSYRVCVTVTVVWVLYGMLRDLFFVFGDIKKMSWNLCVTTLILGVTYKNIQMLQKYETINALRWNLHRDAESRRNPDHILINDSVVKELKLLRLCFHIAASVFIPFWIFSKYSVYFGGVRELPIPFRVPDAVDLENNFQFHVFFIFLASVGTVGAFLAIHTELSMFGLLLQILREYKILQRDIQSVDTLYENDDPDKTEMNYVLKKHKTKTLLRSCSARLNTIIEYTEAFESSFNKPLLQEYLGISIVILTLALQCLWGSVDFAGNLLFQMGYLSTITVNMFLICLFSTRLQNECLEVGEAAYSTLWYKMGPEIQKDIAMIIMRSQHPPKITTGKFMVLSLNFFMNMMSHLYSWIALFRQLEASTSS